MSDASPEVPYVARATVVVTLSDGSRVSWVIDGSKRSELVVTDVPEYNERRTASLLTDHVPTGLFDLTFTLCKVRGHTMYDQSPAEPPAVDQSAFERVASSLLLPSSGADSGPLE